VADDVFEHHDGVVDDEADGEGEGQQGDVIDAEIEEIHDPEGADDSDRHGDAGDERGREGAQEEEDHEHYENDREDEGELHVVHGVADGDRAVHDGLEVDGGGELGAEGGQEGLHAVDDLDGIGAGLALNGEDDGAGLLGAGGERGVFDALFIARVEPAEGFFVLDAVGDVGDVAEADGSAVAVADDDLAEALGALELAG
jgi:hypothetical protein